LKTENRVLIDTNQALTNANLELARKCDDLRQQLRQKREEMRSMRKEFKEAAQWKSQAEAGQAAQKELLDFKNEAATAFSKLMGGGSR
jgi:uncharacterized membrane protein